MVKAVALIVGPWNGMVLRGAKILSGEYKGLRFALDRDQRGAAGEFVVVEFWPDDQFATVVG